MCLLLLLLLLRVLLLCVDAQERLGVLVAAGDGERGEVGGQLHGLARADQRDRAKKNGQLRSPARHNRQVVLV